MVGLLRGVFERGNDVAWLKVRIVGEDVFATDARGQQVQVSTRSD